MRVLVLTCGFIFFRFVYGYMSIVMWMWTNDLHITSQNGIGGISSPPVANCLTASNILSWKATYQAFLESINNSIGRDTKSLPRACSESFNPRQLCCRRRSRIGIKVRRRVQQSVALVSGGGACGERSPAVSR